MEYAIYFLLVFVPILFLLTRKSNSPKRLPPGSLGWPLIGQSFEFLKARKENRLETWLSERARKYGPISKMHFFGLPTVFVHGQALNKLVYTTDEKVFSSEQPTSIRMLLGERSILELRGEDHKRLRRAVTSFLNPEALKEYVGKMHQEIRMHLDAYWHHDQVIEANPLIRMLTFNVICTLVFGIERGERREGLIRLFEDVIRGAVEIPVNLPFTRFNRSLRAGSKVREIIVQVIQERRAKMEIEEHPGDLISSMMSMRDGANKPLISQKEILDNCLALMIAGHDTTSTLLTFFIKMLAQNPQVYEAVLNEQEEIAKGKGDGELLSWDDLNKMKYTWKVATETMRMHPPVPMSFRRVLQDVEIEGCTIPKGWQVAWAGSMTHMDGSIFTDPKKFDPSRHDNLAIPPFSYIPFGAGPRMCPGNEFARIETLTMIHSLVTRFKWRLTLEDNFFCYDPMPVFREGLPIHVIEIKKPLHDALI